MRSTGTSGPTRASAPPSGGRPRIPFAGVLAGPDEGTVGLARSDWRLGPADDAIQGALLDGYLGAASAIAPSRAGAFRDWRERRARHLEAGRSELTVGHLDLLYLPTTSGRTA